MNPIVGDPRAFVYIALAAVFAAIILAFLFVSWRDSIRALREFFALPLRIRRPQFRLRTLIWVTAGCAVVLKAGIHFQWWAAWPWFDRILGGLLIFAGFLLLCVLVRSYLSTYDRTPKVRNVKVTVPSNEDQEAAAGSKRNRKKRVRPKVKRRKILPFRY